MMMVILTPLSSLPPMLYRLTYISPYQPIIILSVAPSSMDLKPPTGLNRVRGTSILVVVLVVSVFGIATIPRANTK